MSLLLIVSAALLVQEPAVAAKDLVIGEHAQRARGSFRRQQESRVEHADHQSRRRRAAEIAREQFVEPLRLSLIVAQNHGRRAVAHQTRQAFDVAIDRFRRQYAKANVHGIRRADHDRAE